MTQSILIKVGFNNGTRFYDFYNYGGCNNSYYPHSFFLFNEYKTTKNTKEIQKIPNEAKPYIDKFVNLYIDDQKLWPPTSLSVSNEEIKDFKELLSNKGVSISFGKLKRIVHNELEEKKLSIFIQNFLNINKHLINSKDNKEWSKAYVKTFEENRSYVRYIAQYLKLGKQEIINLVENEIEKRRREKRVDKLEKAMTDGKLHINRVDLSNIDKMDPYKFEEFIGKLFANMGYKIEVTQASSDQGADIIIEKLGERTVIQAKRYSDTVGNKAVQEAVAAKAHYNCQNAMVVTNNYFTKSAKELASSNNVELIDRDKLDELLKKYI